MSSEMIRQTPLAGALDTVPSNGQTTPLAGALASVSSNGQTTPLAGALDTVSSNDQTTPPVTNGDSNVPVNAQSATQLTSGFKPVDIKATIGQLHLG